MTGQTTPVGSAVGAALSIIVIFIAVVSIPLATGADLSLDPGEITGWIMAIYGVAGIATVGAAWWYRQPLLLTGNIFLIIFVARLGQQLSWAEIIGAAMAAGVVVLGLAMSGLTDRLARWLPAPIVFGLLAGAVVPFFAATFDALGSRPLLGGGMIVAFFATRLVDRPAIPPLLVALTVGLALAIVGEELAPTPEQIAWTAPMLTAPQFSLEALATATPVMVVLITLQANAPSVVYLRQQGYDAPEHVISIVSGSTTTVGSLLGPIGISLSLPATALTAGPDAGPVAGRHRAVLAAGAASLGIALLAGLADEVAAVLPTQFLAVAVGLAVINILTQALHHVTEGPLVLGPIFTFGIALSDLTLLRLGPFFWALAIGLAVSVVVERDAWRSLHPAHAA